MSVPEYDPWIDIARRLREAQQAAEDALELMQRANVGEHLTDNLVPGIAMLGRYADLAEEKQAAS